MKLGIPMRRLPLLAVVLALAACADGSDLAGPDTREPERPNALVSLACTASVQARTVHCGAPSTGGARAVIIGGQNRYVTLTSSNIQVVADTIAFDVTVGNLIPQPLGTSDGTSADAAGVRVFFEVAPTSTGAGMVTVANADGTGSFTGGIQPYYQYDGILPQDSTSAPKRWKFQFTPEVTQITFKVYVAAAVPYSNGYVDGTPYTLTLNPGETVGLPSVVRNFLGDALPGETVSWTSNAPGTASVSGTQVTAGGANGLATLTALSGARRGVYETSVSVCPAPVVTNGTTLPASISSSDCFSSFGSSEGRPSTSYYGDLYRVALTAGQTVTVIMDSGDDLDTYLLLADRNLGFLVAGNDDDDEGSLGVGSRLTYTATVSGVYVIEASTFNGLDTGNYTLQVSIS